MTSLEPRDPGAPDPSGPDASGPQFSCEILTLFPEMIHGYARASILGRAVARGLVHLGVSDIRDFAVDRHRIVDDVPYGGGAGMVMKPGPLVAAVEAARLRLPGARVVLLSPRGPRFDQARARELRDLERLVLVCGRYEGVDERALAVVDEELSLGDFVLTGGELAALCVLDAVARLVPGVLGNADSAAAESFVGGVLEHPHFTRPPVFRGVGVPSVLLSGDHRRIARWRRRQALLQTRDRRPDLFQALALTDAERELLERETEDDRDPHGAPAAAPAEPGTT